MSSTREWIVRDVADLAAAVQQRVLAPWSTRSEWVLEVNPAEYRHISEQRLSASGAIADNWSMEMRKALAERFRQFEFATGSAVPSVRLIVGLEIGLIESPGDR